VDHHEISAKSTGNSFISSGREQGIYADKTDIIELQARDEKTNLPVANDPWSVAAKLGFPSGPLTTDS
jgi:hypothetical protein